MGSKQFRRRWCRCTEQAEGAASYRRRRTTMLATHLAEVVKPDVIVIAGDGPRRRAVAVDPVAFHHTCGLTGGGRSRQTATVTVHRTVAADGVESWSGTFKTRAILTRGGKRLDRVRAAARDIDRGAGQGFSVTLSVFVVLFCAAS